jgi:RNA polymerase primary sigma factor
MRQLKITKSITNREDRSLEKYLQEISRYSVINATKEVELAKKIKEGDKKALEELIRANLRFVVSVAKQYQNQGLSLNDLINEGNLGLIKAAKRFDETRGFKFISYAVWWIRQSILQALAEQARIIRLPLNRLGLLNKIKHTSTALEQKLEREPTNEEIAIVLEKDESIIAEHYQIQGKQASIDAPLSNDGETNTLLDVLPSNDTPPTDDTINREGLQTELGRALSKLTEREADVIKMFYGLEPNRPMTLEEISTRFDMTRERIRQIKEKALRKLKHPSRSKILKTYLSSSD